jgi:sirohydrochlorin ferrochelatase
MINGTLLLVGRHTDGSSQAMEVHAERLRDRDIAASVRVARYDRTHAVDGDGAVLSGVEPPDDGAVFLLPAVMANTGATGHAVRAIAASLPDPVCVCDPIGRAPAVSRLLLERAEDAVDPSAETALVLVGFGSGSPSGSRGPLEYHERRLRGRSDYGEVRSCYLLQDPTAECVRYNTSGRRMVVVPAFISPGPAIRTEIRAKIRDERVTYAEPIGTHPLLTDAMHAAVTKRYVLETRDNDDTSPPTTAAERWGGRIDADGGRIPDRD